MSFLFNQILNLVLIYGYPIIGISMVVSSIGLPLPQTSIILAAGSLADAGELNIFILFILITLCSILGDVFDYFLGRKIGELIYLKVKKHSPKGHKVWLTTQKTFLQWSGLTIFLSRWLFSPISAPVSLIAGFSKYSVKKFLFFDILGQIVSSIIFLSIGYFFNASWIYIWEYFASIPGIITILALGLFLVIFGMRRIYSHKRK